MSTEFDCDLYFILITQTNELSVSLGSAFCSFLSDCVFLVGLWALFMGPATWENTNLMLKLGPTILFLHLKIILLQYFQFSVLAK